MIINHPALIPVRQEGLARGTGLARALLPRLALGMLRTKGGLALG